MAKRSIRKRRHLQKVAACLIATSIGTSLIPAYSSKKPNKTKKKQKKK